MNETKTMALCCFQWEIDKQKNELAKPHKNYIHTNADAAAQALSLRLYVQKEKFFALAERFKNDRHYHQYHHHCEFATTIGKCEKNASKYTNSWTNNNNENNGKNGRKNKKKWMNKQV